MDRVTEVLERRLRLEALTAREQDAVFDRLGDWFNQPSEAVRAQYAALGERPGTVGNDRDGRLVRRRADGDLEPID